MEMSKENVLVKLKTMLDFLRKREAQTAGFAPMALLMEIADYEEAISLTQQAIRGEIDETVWSNKLQPIFTTLGISALSSQTPASTLGFPSLFRVEEDLTRLKQTYRQLSRQKTYTSDPAKSWAIKKSLDHIQGQIFDFEKQWHHLNNQAVPGQDRLQVLYQKISEVREILAMLEQRGMHQKNLDLLEKYLAEARTEYAGLSLEKLIEPKLKQEQDKIRFIERQGMVSVTEQNRLKIHRKNVEFYQQMLTGELPYVPLQTLHQVEKEKQALEEIDAKMAAL